MEVFVDEQATATSGGSTKTLTLTFGTPFAAGDTVIVVTAFETETNTAVVTDGASSPNTYTADTPNIDAGLHWITQWHRFTYATIPGTNQVILTLANGVASKGIWALRYTGIDPLAVLRSVWNKQVAPGTAANGLLTGTLTPVKQPYLALQIAMSKTGTAGALASTGTPGYTNRAAAWTFAGGSGNCARMSDKRILSLAPFQATFTAGVGTDTYISGMMMLGEAGVVNPYKCNPMGLAFQSVTGVSQYAHTSGMLITGRGNRYDAAFQSARAAGAEILAYLDFMERPDASIGALDDTWYMGNPAIVPLWPYLTNGNTAGIVAGQQRINFTGNHMTDITVGSAWVTYGVNYIANLMRENLVDGVFLDVIGGRLFSTGTTGANWGLIGAAANYDWTQAEMNAWTAGCIDIVRQLDVLRRSINPNFIIVNNNTWDTGDALNNGFLGEQYVDGVDLEHHPSTSSYQQAYAAKNTFSNLGHRRFLVIANDTTDAIAWAQIPGVTNVSDQHGGGAYNAVSAPPIAFSSVTDRVAPVNRAFGPIRAGSGLILPFST